MKAAARVSLLVTMLLPVQAIAQESCNAAIEEFSLLTRLHAEKEGLDAYRQLLLQCPQALRAITGKAVLPDAGHLEAVMALGEGIYQQRQTAFVQRAGSTLSHADIPMPDMEALRGMGPESIGKAVTAAALGVASAAAESRQQWEAAGQLERLASQLRGGSPGLSGLSPGFSAGTAPRQPQIALPQARIEQASCSGDLSFLAPSLRPYADVQLNESRNTLLSESIPEAILKARQQGYGKQAALQALNAQTVEYENVAAEAAQTARQSEGAGDSVAAVLQDVLPIGFQCGISSVHSAAVCEFILMRWASLATRAVTQLMDRCWTNVSASGGGARPERAGECDMDRVIGTCSAQYSISNIVAGTVGKDGERLQSGSADLVLTSSAPRCSRISYYIDNTPYISLLKGGNTAQERIILARTASKDTVSIDRCEVFAEKQD